MKSKKYKYSNVTFAIYDLVSLTNYNLTSSIIFHVVWPILFRRDRDPYQDNCTLQKRYRLKLLY